MIFFNRHNINYKRENSNFVIDYSGTYILHLIITCIITASNIELNTCFFMQLFYHKKFKKKLNLCQHKNYCHFINLDYSHTRKIFEKCYYNQDSKQTICMDHSSRRKKKKIPIQHYLNTCNLNIVTLAPQYKNSDHFILFTNSFNILTEIVLLLILRPISLFYKTFFSNKKVYTYRY